MYRLNLLKVDKDINEFKCNGLVQLQQANVKRMIDDDIVVEKKAH